MDVRRVSAQGVAELIQGPQKDDVAVVDVRDKGEVAEGHVKGAINVESADILSGDAAVVDSLIQRLNGKSKVVVHCALSKIRGPACASRIAERLQQLGKSSELDVVVMDGGFNSFGQLYAGNADLIENGQD